MNQSGAIGYWYGEGKPASWLSFTDINKVSLNFKNNLADKQSERVIQIQAFLKELITKGRSTPGSKQQNDVKVRRY